MSREPLLTSEPFVQAKLDALRALLREMGSALVCYSGGIDSALVLAVAWPLVLTLVFLPLSGRAYRRLRR
jgi:PP-loop superfamily ATP-utilizing enzyme